MGEKQNLWKQASAYVFVATFQMFAVLFWKPYQHSGMHGLMVFLYLSGWFGCSLGLFVVIIADSSLEYPVYALYGFWALSAAIGAIVAIVSKTQHGRRDMVAALTAFTPLDRLLDGSA